VRRRKGRRQRELGLNTFGDVGRSPATGLSVTPAERIPQLVEEIVLADQVGLDVFGLGEHHRPDYAVSAPAMVLAGAATRTSRMRLSSAVTVLSSEDPIRVHQHFATLDNLSGGRAEIMVGRGSFIENFTLFGYDLDDYDALFAEKLSMLLAIREGEILDWPGSAHTHPVPRRGVWPRPVQERLPVWVAVGGTPGSVARAGQLGPPLALAIIGGEPRRFAPLFDLYRQAAARAGHDAATLPTSLNVHGFVAETRQKALDVFAPPVMEVMTRIGAERGWPPMTRAAFEASAGADGALFLGSPAEVADKILAAHEVFGFSRFVIQMAIGVMDHGEVMRAIELFGTKVAPELRKATG
jgi:probable LLM family oxidoreductase